MCNLYTVRKSAEDVAAHFEAEVPKPIDMKPDTAKGGRGIVVRAHNGRRLVQEVGWGFRVSPAKCGKRTSPRQRLTSSQI